MREENIECPYCGERFSSGEYLEGHIELEHSEDEESEVKQVQSSFRTGLRNYLNISAIIGFLIGFLVASAGISGAFFLQDIIEEDVKVTVVTCEECSYERFKTATDRMFNVNYREVNYQSSEGQEMIGKYNLNYVPGFVFDKTVEERSNFTRVRNALVEFDDAYVMSDAGEKTAQRFSEGIELSDE